jgi:hypothetical protein
VTTAALIVPGPIINGMAMVPARCSGAPRISPMVSATGIEMSIGEAALVIAFTLFLTCSILILMKFSHDHLLTRAASPIDISIPVTTAALIVPGPIINGMAMVPASFEAFQIFGGLIFLVIGYRYVFQGADTIGEMRGAPELFRRPMQIA